MQTRTKNILATSILALAWIVAMAVGFRAVVAYDNRPGPVGAAPKIWPTSTIALAPDRPTLVMLAHPRCPCTRASVNELAQVMTQLHGKVAAYVLFVTPKDGGPDWESTDLRRSAEQIPGVQVITDVDGAEAARFGAETSGHTFLFGADGQLLFSGGITQSRGHAGENAGENAIIAVVNHTAPQMTRTFVYGCALADQKKQTAPAHCLR